MADKYNVTYQAVSKWENGKNMPDISLIKQISKDFNISLEELFDTQNKQKKYKYIIFIFLFILIVLIIVLNIFKSDDFKFKTLTTDKKDFNIPVSIAYHNIDKTISSYKYEGKKSIKLSDFLKDVNLTTDNYENNCKHPNNSLYLSIEATTNHDKIVKYKIPIKLINSCIEK